MIVKAKKEIINNVFQILFDMDYDNAKESVIVLSKDNGVIQKRIIPISDVHEVITEDSE